MNSAERKAVLSLAGITSIRMFGLFLLLPVLAVHASGFDRSTPLLVGMAMGAYGLTQAMLQIPFGLMSDRFGRKRIIGIGLGIFFAGSIVAALADSIEWLIIGRALQGGGAVSAAVLALTADLTREEQRTKAMALIGIGIGFVFLLSLTLAPPLSVLIGIDGMFWLTALLALVAIAILYFLVPTPQRTLLHRDVAPVGGQIGEVLRNGQLLRLDFGIFFLHTLMTGLFVVLPAEISRLGALELAQHWRVYLPVVVLSVAGMVPLILIASRQGMTTRMFQLATVVLTTALAVLALTSGIFNSFTGMLAALWLYFVGFNALEAMLPSLVSRVAPAASKGTAIGVYNTMQFLGIFAGGLTGGLLAGTHGATAVFTVGTVIGILWVEITLFAPKFELLSSLVLNIDAQSEMQRQALVDRISQVRGVQEVTILQGEPLAYLKVNDKDLDTDALYQLKDLRRS
ncbi:MAG: MFS transporter [Gammaproteobacteria bacterium]|nr:MFS transporter [Gammaproteobacteria bacterium]